MSRLLSAVLAVLVLLLPALLPDVPDARLAARSAGDLVESVPTSQATLAEDERRTLFDLLHEEYGSTIPVGGFRFDAPAEAGAEFNDIFTARQSLVRALRSTAQARGLADVEVTGELAPVQGGVVGHVRFEGGDLVGRFETAAGASHDVAGDVSLPDRRTLWPPLVAVALAILLRRPLVALFLGVLVGAVLLHWDAGPAAAAWRGLVEVPTVYFWSEFVDPERALIIGFVVFMLAMVGVLTRSGAIRGLMDAIARHADSPRGTQVSTYLMGLAIFFDDYANTILVGSTMRPLADKYRISREKLAYLVDSTAAPVAGLSIFSTWIAFEVSTFNAQLPSAGLAPSDGYAVFLETIPFSFYCLFTLFFVACVVFSGRDFGPMYRAELRARTGNGLLAPGATPMVSEEATSMEPHPNATPRAANALWALGSFLLVTLAEIARGGELFGYADGAVFFAAEKLSSIEGITGILYDGSGSWPLFAGSLAGLLTATFGAIAGGVDAGSVVQAAWRTLRAMGVAFAILYLAWMIGAVTSDLDTAGYLTAFVGDSIPPGFLPTCVFLLAGVIAFATGSSWSTMSILLPIAVPLAYQLGLPAELAATAEESGRALMVISIGAVLSGAIFGDHCSPISDTTVMSSIASACDHIDHVRTQAPYALVTMAIAVGAGYVPAAHGTSPWLCLAGGVVLVAITTFALGRRAPAV